MKQKQIFPTAAAITAAIIFGFSFLFTKDALFYLNPLQLLGLRFALAALVLTLLAVCRIVTLRIQPAHLTDLLKIAVWQPAGGALILLGVWGTNYFHSSRRGRRSRTAACADNP